MPKFKYNPSVIQTTDTIQLLPTVYEDKINEKINLHPMWPTSGLIAIEFLLDQYDEIYLHGFDSQSEKYEYIHYYDKGDNNRLTKRYKLPRIDHDYNKEKEYLDLLRNQKKVIDIA